MEKKFSILFFLLLTTSLSFAGRPLSTNDAGVVDLNTFEFELGYEGSFDQGTDKEHELTASLKYGISERLDIGFETPYVLSPEHGFESAQISAKFRLYNGNAVFPAAAAKFAYLVDGSEYVIKGILTKKISNFRVDINGIYATNGKVGEKGVPSACAAIKWYALKRAAFVFEVRGKNQDDDVNGHVLLGTVISAFRDFEPDIAIVKNIGPNTSDSWGIRFGFTHVF